MPEVRLVNVTKRFGKVVAVDGVNLHVRDREYFTIVGPSGCGKTTTLRLIAGLIEPDEGEIYIGGRAVRGVPPEERKLGFVFQTLALFPHMTVWDNVAYGPRARGWASKQVETVAREMLEMVKLLERRASYPHELSGGMAQRVALARALAAGAELLLLDEPLASLDVGLRRELRHELRRFVKDLGLTAIHVTHDQEEALTISDRIAVMRRGKIEQVGTPRELYYRPATLFVAGFIGESNFLEGVVTRSSKGSMGVEIEGGHVLTVPGEFRKGDRVVLCVRPEQLRFGRAKRNVLPGVVDELYFAMGAIHYKVSIEGGGAIKVRTPFFPEHPKLGDRVLLHASPDDFVAFAYPARGLAEELAP